MSLSTTVAATPLTADFAQRVLSAIAALTGIPTDFNIGSQVRTLAESMGSVNETQGVWAQALALQAIYASAVNAFGITASGATFAVGTATFSTSPSGSAPPVPQAVAIPAGTVLQTSAGITFQTVASGVLASGAGSVTVGVQSTIAGPAGNVPPNAISTINSNLAWPLFVTASVVTTKGVAAEIPSQTQARFAARVGSLGLSSPYAVANACVGVQASGSSEAVLYAACFEPWAFIVGGGSGGYASGFTSGSAGFFVFLDNGTGGASSGLIAAVNSVIFGNPASGMSGFRPAGVPYAIDPVTPIFANVVVSGTLLAVLPASTVSGSVVTAIDAYFAGLPIGSPAQQPQIAAIAANNGMNLFTSLSVQLFVSGSGTSIPAITGNPWNRVILSSLSLTLGN